MSISQTSQGSTDSQTTSPVTKDVKTSDKKSKSLLHILPKLPSNDSLSNSPGPASPGERNERNVCSSPATVNETSAKTNVTTCFYRNLLLFNMDNGRGSLQVKLYRIYTVGGGETLDCLAVDKPSDPSLKLARKTSYKVQRKHYRREKKRMTNELLNSLKDPAVVVMADWLKIRGTLKTWTKLWCVLNPGMLLLYKSSKSKNNHWVGTILLNTCKVIERPSKKDGFCFKLYNPLDQSIWAPRGPENETIGAVVQPLPSSYSIFRASSQGSGICWLNALEISIRNDSALVRSVSSKSTPGSTSHETQWSEADYEKHFDDNDLDDISQPDNGGQLGMGDCEISDSDSEVSVKDDFTEDEPPQTPYVPNCEEEFEDAGAQEEELADEHKSLIWYLIKQVRPGMDLSKVVLPTFILEPRSFLDKLTDSYYHVDILSRAVIEDDAFTRMKTVVQWYLSGFYKKPKGLKKPYNPILGETFRCYWQHSNGAKTFYVAEQVSHHPPISAFYVINREEGFSITASILAKSRFYGNSTSAILDGTAVLTLLPRGEIYTLTVPYAHCKGLLMGTLSMELGGKVIIDCEKTGYHTEIDFKLKPFLGGAEHTNCITGRLRRGKETLATIDGHWDSVINIKDKRTGDKQVLWNPITNGRNNRLVRYTVASHYQDEYESERLWQHVSTAINWEDLNAATKEKTSLEKAQRASLKERKAKGEEWKPKHFEQVLKTGQWVYKYSDSRPWNPRNDLYQYEHEYVICTKTKHETAMIDTSNVINIQGQTGEIGSSNMKIAKTKINTKQPSSDAESDHSDSTQSVDKISVSSATRIVSAINELHRGMEHNNEILVKLQEYLDQHLEVERKRTNLLCYKMFLLFFIVTVSQALISYYK